MGTSSPNMLAGRYFFSLARLMRIYYYLVCIYEATTIVDT